jgi:hypothetical protein
MSHWFVKVMYTNNSIEFYPLLFFLFMHILNPIYIYVGMLTYNFKNIVLNSMDPYISRLL